MAKKRDEILNSEYPKSDFGLDQGEALLRGIRLKREMDEVNRLFDEFEKRARAEDPELQHLQETFRTIVLKTPALKKSLDNLLILWKELNTLSNLHKDRLKLLEISLAGLEDNEHFISEIENQLARHQDLPQLLKA
ncbi:hypothetical protein EVAR_101734_1 [Eumeta japonica]|uniref:Uncharacterized protein n=1 Tax=Eumeta variegata TaxID=151549 RepID=A0A4C1TED5_EUMVA|nr:hypothetical protein EVAR_101734_1 [Eumeta japonica]